MIALAYLFAFGRSFRINFRRKQDSAGRGHSRESQPTLVREEKKVWKIEEEKKSAREKYSPTPP